MLPPVFYANPEACSQDLISLSTPESHHALKVMRLSLGALVVVVDGVGNACRGEVAHVRNRKTVEVAVHSRIRNFGEPMVRLTLAAGLSTGSKFDSVVEKGTELGVVRFAGILCQKSKIKLDDPSRVKSRKTRLEKVALAAMKQCRRSYRPDISIPVGLDDFLAETDPESLNLIFHPGGARFEQLAINPDIRRASALVGPESGFTDEEVQRAVGVGYQQVSLGQRILRTETAGPIVSALIMNRLGDLI